MKTFKLYFLLALPVIFLSGSPKIEKDELLDILIEEMNREMDGFKNVENPPYFLSYLVTEEHSSRIQSSFGAITGEDNNHSRVLDIDLRIGNYELDNSHEIRDRSFFGSFGYNRTSLPIENNDAAIKQIIWQATNKKYREAADKYAKVLADASLVVEKEDTSADFTKEKAYQYYEKPLLENKLKIDNDFWKQKLKAYSAVFLENPDMLEGNVTLTYNVVRKTFVNSEGSKIAQNLVYARIFMSGLVKAEDGMLLPLHKDYFAFDVKDFPDDETIKKDIRLMCEKLTALKNAEVVEPYTGPAILSGEASGVFFHEIFGHRIEGQRQKKESDGQTFKKKVGENVLPEHLSVIFDPNLTEYEGYFLNGHYKYDDQGIKAQKVDVVKNGILNEFLMSRCPIEGFDKSNGHARAQKGYEPVSRQSNMFIKTNNPKTEEDLRNYLIEEAKKQGLEYGFYFKAVAGGFTTTGRYRPNAFNVTPLEVYKIYVDGRPDELVRGVDIIGTPLSMFSKIEYAANNPGLFTGFCGAESGRVPVSTVSPSLYIQQIELQKKGKSREKPLILERPDLDKDGKKNNGEL
jgi:TldD protein